MPRPAATRRAAVLLVVTALTALTALTACGADRAALPGAPGTAPTATPTALSWTSTHFTGGTGSFTWVIVLPRAVGSPAAPELNRRVTASAQDVVDAARASVQDGDPPRTLAGQGAVTTDDGRTAQVLLEVVDNTDGTAHPTTVASTVLDVQRARPVTLDVVFTDPPAAFERLAPVVEDLASAAGEPVTAPEGLAPEEQNRATWQSGPEGIAFSFQDYQLGGHGVRRYVVPWERVEPLLTAEARELLAPA